MKRGVIKSKKGALEVSFQWIFAIIVGAAVLALAIYVVVKYIGIEETGIDAKTGKQIGILTDPLETGFESDQVVALTMPVSTRIYNKCDTFGDFGKQIIQVSQKSMGKWTDTNIDVNFKNKYLFSENYVEGKEFYLFSKPFEWPFKIANLIYIIPKDKKYCFVDAPKHVKDNLENLNINSIIFDECSEKYEKVCFNNENCNINVKITQGFVEKQGKKLYFDGIEDDNTLLFAAIFSSSENYECQVKRLMDRLITLSSLYRDKAVFIAREGCTTDVEASLAQLSSLASGLGDSQELLLMKSAVEQTNKKNENNIYCRLW